MRKAVNVTIEGLQGEMELENASVSTAKNASFYEKGESRYLLFEEQLEGFAKPFQTRIKLREGLLELQRKGETTIELCFEEGRCFRTSYQTPFGTLPLEIVTKDVTMEKQGDFFTVNVEYTMEFAEAPKEECSLKIMVTAVEE